MGTMIDLHTADGATIGAYKATPPGRSKGGIVVVQEIFGVNHHIKSVADRFAGAGYTALAPAIFDRAERGVELAYDAPGMKRGMELASTIPREQHLASVLAAVDALASEGPVGIVGFCLGGTLAYAAAAADDKLAAAVGFYGGGIAEMAGAKPHCPIELHFGERDDHIPMSDIDAIRTARPEIPVHTYPAGHGFNCDERGSYDKASADKAWARALAFLDKHLER